LNRETSLVSKQGAAGMRRFPVEGYD
jgi:hypothetical protein